MLRHLQSSRNQLHPLPRQAAATAFTAAAAAAAAVQLHHAGCHQAADAVQQRRQWQHPAGCLLHAL
jgi:hypothetical protein